jgi:hypothetical protein
MEYRGKNVACDIDDLVMIPGADDESVDVGYYGAGGSFVTIASFENEFDADEAYSEICDMLMAEDVQLWGSESQYFGVV